MADENKYPAPIVPDVDPVARALTQMRAAAQHTSPLAPARGTPTREFEFSRRITQLEDLIESLGGGSAGEVLTKDTNDGFSFVWGPGGGGGGPSGPYPFDVELTGSGSPLTASILPGTLNGLIPTNIFSTYPLAVPGTYYLVLAATAATGEIASCSLSMPTSPPVGIPTVMGEPPLSFDYLLGVVIDGVWFRTIGNGSLSAAGQEVFRISKASPAPGTLPYDIYYTWNIVHN